MRRHVRRAILPILGLAAASVALCASAKAQVDVMPAARIVIYPGEVIRDDMLEDIPATAPGIGGPFAFARSDVLGKMSHRTLLPGRPIPLHGIDNPRVVVNGAQVQMVYIDGGLQIVTTGAALQDGAVGDFIKLRNVDSGVVISGQIQADGTVLVSGG
jgi:flagella basal body P-ring formation protein FlgA